MENEDKLELAKTIVPVTMAQLAAGHTIDALILLHLLRADLEEHRDEILLRSP
jgi:hypothetical protein